MQVEPLSIAGSWAFTPVQHGDDRGLFLEWYKADLVAEVWGRPLLLAQANHSVSKAGVVRGIHYADVPPGQAKYVYCPRGAVLDVIVDLRVGSPTFGQCESLRLDDVDRRAVLISEGLGHGFAALSDGATLTYLCSTPYNPTGERTVNPTDPTIAVDWGVAEPTVSARDAAGPTLLDAQAAGVLPDFAACQSFYSEAGLRT